MLDGGFEELVVATAELVEAALKAALEAAHESPGTGGTVLMAAHDVHDQRGDERPGEEVGGQHGENDGLGERHEQKLGDARQEEHGDEDDADADSRDESGDGNLGSPIENRLLHF